MSAEPPEITPPQNPPPAASSDDNMMAMLAHLLGIFTWFVGALIIWLIKKDQSTFVGEQAKEALNFQITVGIASVASGVLAVVGIGFLLGAAVWVCNLIFCIMGAMAANQGKPYSYPINLRLIK